MPSRAHTSPSNAGEDTDALITGGRFTTDETGFAQMLALTARFTDKVWAVEGCSGIGKHVAVRLLEAGETRRRFTEDISWDLAVVATVEDEMVGMVRHRAVERSLGLDDFGRRIIMRVPL